MDTHAFYSESQSGMGEARALGNPASSAAPAPAPSSGSAPKLAIIIPCYNYARYVGRAIESVLSQGREDCEVLVVDDGSTDGSWDVITATGVEAMRVPNGGPRKACLAGLERTSAPFVLFLDADDELVPGALATIIANLDPSVAKLQYGLARIDEEGDLIDPAPAAGQHPFRERQALVREVLERGYYESPPTSGNVFRRDVCALLQGADYDFYVDGITLFAAPFMGDIVGLAEPLGRYRVHAANMSGIGKAPQAAQIERELQRYCGRFRHLERLLGEWGLNASPTMPEHTFFYQERAVQLAVANGRRPRLSRLPRTMHCLARERLSLGRKMAIGAVLGLAFVLPVARSRRLIAYRNSMSGRSALGALKVLFSTPKT